VSRRRFRFGDGPQSDQAEEVATSMLVFTAATQSAGLRPRPVGAPHPRLATSRATDVVATLIRSAYAMVDTLSEPMTAAKRPCP
jgi:phage tail sheath protein FI